MQQTTVYVTQPQQPVQRGTFVAVPAAPVSPGYPNYPEKRSVVLGSLCIVVQVLSIIFNCIGFALQLERPSWEYNNWLMYAMDSVWGGIMVILAGAFAIGAGKVKSKCLVIATMVLAIFSALFSFIMICWSTSAVSVEDSHDTSSSYNYNSYYYDPYYGARKDTDTGGTKAMAALKLIAALFTFIASIWISSLCCSVACCGARQTTVHHVQQNQMQVSYVNVPPPVAGATFVSTTTAPQPVVTGNNTVYYQPPPQYY